MFKLKSSNKQRNFYEDGLVTIAISFSRLPVFLSSQVGFKLHGK
jgi:hypothetical protein